jgi:hypothetical protein
VYDYRVTYYQNTPQSFKIFLSLTSCADFYISCADYYVGSQAPPDRMHVYIKAGAKAPIPGQRVGVGGVGGVSLAVEQVWESTTRRPQLTQHICEGFLVLFLSADSLADSCRLPA